MKNFFIFLFVLFFSGVIFFIINTTTAVFKPETSAQKEAKKAYMTHYKAHNKAIGKAFVVDSIAYIVHNFTYVPQKDTMTLIVDLAIENKTKRGRLFVENSFSVIGDAKKVYYPRQIPFTVFENRTQKLKLIYHLPKNITPTMYAELHIKSATDSLQNAFLIFAKSYRSEG
jgi:hypothetical protein